MKNRQGEYYSDGRLVGHVIASNDQFALIRFVSISGFVSLAAGCDGEYPLVMTIGLPPHLMTADLVDRLHRSVPRFFDCDRSDCLLVTTRPTRIARAQSYVLPADKVPSPLSPSPKAEPEELFSFPRRFDLASMLVISSGYALLFAGMRLFDASPYLMFATGGLIAVVGVSQAVLFSGNEPRKASLIVGGVYCAIAIGIVTAMGTNRSGSVIGASMLAVFWGPPVGYIAGALVGGVFLVAEYTRRGIAEYRERQKQPPPKPTDKSDGD